MAGCLTPLPWPPVGREIPVMSDYVIAPPPTPFVPVAGGGRFPVRRILCVGRNYPEHAREMGSDPEREPPFFFAKPADAVLTGGAEMTYPTATAELHPEMELVVAIGAGGAGIAAGEASGHVFGYAAGLDMTRRDLQAAAKKTGRPWDLSKGFDQSAVIGDIRRAPGTLLASGRITLSVNGMVRQASDLAEMIWPVAETIAHLSRFIALAAGDLLFTGTPAGVASVSRGDRLLGSIDGVGSVSVRLR